MIENYLVKQSVLYRKKEFEVKKIVHIITGLGSGGAENMLYKLLKYSDKERFHHEVISLMDEGVYGEKIEKLGIKVHCLNLNSKNIVPSLIKSRKIAKDADIINTWLYHADIFGFIVAKILLRKKLIWNIRHSNLDKDANKARTLKIVKINSVLSKHVDLITYNSNKALETHTEFGYKKSDSVVIPNGFELEKFKFNINDRNRIRNDLNLRDIEKVIITVGRWDIQKDYYTLLKALKNLKNKNNNFKMLMVGTNLDDENDIVSAFSLGIGVTFSFRVYRNSIENMILFVQIYFFLFLFIFLIQVIKNKFRIKIKIKK